MSLDRRTQLLLDEERYRLLEERASRDGTSVAAVIRLAIDNELGRDPDDAAEAVRELLDMPPADFPDWPTVEDEIEATYERARSESGA
jgi:cytochrome c-type biogenesis protein CcmH/NrfG